MKSASRLVASLIDQGADVDSRLCLIRHQGSRTHISTKDITITLRFAVNRAGEARLGICGF